MMSQLSTVLIIVFVLPVISMASVGLKPEPVQTLLKTNLLADKDNFDDFDNGKKADSVSQTRQDSKPAASFSGTNVSALKAGLYSALLPGLGEHYTGHKTKAKVFFSVEAIGWIGFVSYQLYGKWRKDDLVNYAATYASADLSDKDDEFIDLVGFYTDIDEYNTAGRVGDRERPYLPDVQQYHWRWQSEQEQNAFRNLKNRSREAFRRSEFMLGLMVLNRVVSIIDAVRDAKRAQRTIDRPFSKGDKVRTLDLAVDPFGVRNQIRVSWYPGF